MPKTTAITEVQDLPLMLPSKVYTRTAKKNLFHVDSEMDTDRGMCKKPFMII